MTAKLHLPTHVNNLHKKINQLERLQQAETYRQKVVKLEVELLFQKVLYQLMLKKPEDLQHRGYQIDVGNCQKDALDLVVEQLESSGYLAQHRVVPLSYRTIIEITSLVDE